MLVRHAFFWRFGYSARAMWVLSWLLLHLFYAKIAEESSRVLYLFLGFEITISAVRLNYAVLGAKFRYVLVWIAGLTRGKTKVRMVEVPSFYLSRGCEDAVKSGSCVMSSNSGNMTICNFSPMPSTSWKFVLRI